MRLGVRNAVVDGAILAGDVVISGDRIGAVGVVPAGSRGTAVPGFVDLQVNGYAGVDFLNADGPQYARAAEALAASGVTSYQPTLVSAPIDSLRAALRMVQALPRGRGPRPVGVHLEGPFLADRWAGAHERAHLRPVDVDLALELCDAGPVATMTVAPELPGGLDLVETLARRGVIVSLGHTDADARCAHAAFDRGAGAVTHIYNAQRRWTPRDPGVAGVALARSDVTVTAILDGVHLAPESACAAFAAARGRFAVVSDATMATGMPDGRYRLGEVEVTVEQGTARTREGALAGGAAGIDQGVRNLVSWSAALPEAVEAAASVPARLLRRTDLGRLAVDGVADVAVLDDGLQVTRTLVAGAEVFGR